MISLYKDQHSGDSAASSARTKTNTAETPRLRQPPSHIESNGKLNERNTPIFKQRLSILSDDSIFLFALSLGRHGYFVTCNDLDNMTQVIRKAILICKALLFTVRTASNFILGISCDRIRAWRASRPLPSNAKSDIPQNIVVIGASFAGYFAASRIARFLPSGDTHRVVVIEPNSHFQFTWVLPRFCVVGGHEHKAFIPYGGLLKGVSSSKIRWIRDCAVSVDQDNVKLRSGNKIPYKYLVIATGSNNNGKLPSRVGSERKEEGEALLREMQSKIKESQNLVVVGGGAAGVELVADAKSRYPDKHITLVHSRAALMHRFGPELQTAALESLQKLGVELVLGERVTSDQPVEGFINTDSGRRLECDMIVSYASIYYD